MKTLLCNNETIYCKISFKGLAPGPWIHVGIFSLSSKTALECFEDIANKFLEKFYSLLCKLDHFSVKEKKVQNEMV
jgi:hypothetical protein